jgi:hypothetical protein
MTIYDQVDVLRVLLQLLQFNLFLPSQTDSLVPCVQYKEKRL